jgi:replicative DNA helicase
LNNLPPQATEIEEGILGSCLLDREVAQIAIDRLTPECFYHSGNRAIFEAIQILWEKNIQVDLLTVENLLKDREQFDTAGGSTYLADLTKYSGVSGNPENYCQILTDKAVLRKTISECQSIIKQAYEHGADAYGVIDDLNRVATNIEGRSKTVHSLTPEQIFEREENTPLAEKLKTGIYQMDEGIYKDAGLHRGQVELSIADSGHGKTQYALYKAELLMRKGYRVLWFQLEDYDLNTAKHFALNCPEQMNNIHICHDLYDIEAIKREARIINRDVGVDYIVFDYVQNIEASKQGRSDQVEYISQQITRLAKDLNVVCHPLSQVTMSYNTRSGWSQEPKYGDVRWSQQLKQDAHIITSVFRPSRIESLVQSHMNENRIEDWTGSLRPFNSVYVRQAKTRYGEQNYKRLHLIHTDKGLKLYDSQRPGNNKSKYSTDSKSPF